jgi:catechol 2,3-dioxygenase-like lactoylglutathione lyase family enzyme
MIEGLSAITLATHDMRRAVRFYQALGFEVLYGGEAAAFTSLRAGASYLNLIAQPAERQWSWWGRHLGSSGTVNLGKAAPARFGGSAERSGSTTNPGFISRPSLRRGAFGSGSKRTG